MAKQPVKQTVKPKSKTAVKQSTAKKPVAASRKKKQSGFGSLLSSIFRGKRKWVTLVIFVLIFGGIGTYLLRESYALSTSISHCTGNNWGASKTTGQCVKDIQRILNGVGGTYSVGSVDGIYGTKTKTGVKNFQSFWGLGNDGVVGPKTWERLCYVAYYNGTDSTNAANNAGCKGSSGAFVVGSSSSTGAVSTGGSYVNGKIPSSAMTYVSFCGSHTMSKPYLRNDAAAALLRMNTAYKAAHGGKSMVIDDCYRDLAGQVYAWNCYVNKNCNNGNKAAKPVFDTAGRAVAGTSNHGLGIAIDFHSASTDYAWIKAHTSYGWKCCTVSGEAWHYKYAP